MSLRAIAATLRQQGYRISHASVQRALQRGAAQAAAGGAA